MESEYNERPHRKSSRVFTVSRRRLMNDQVRVVWPVVMRPVASMPSKFGLRCR